MMRGQQGVQMAILVQGVDIVDRYGMQISELDVEITQDIDADTCAFTVQDVLTPGAQRLGLYDDKMAPGNSIEVLLGYEETGLTSVFEGIIVHVTLEANSSEGPALLVRAVDYSLKLMSGRVINDSWMELTYSEVAMAIAAEYGMNADVDMTSTPASLGGVIVREDPEDNDFRFLQKLADRAGYRFYVSGQTIYFKGSSSLGLTSEMSFDYRGGDVFSFSIQVDLLSQVSSVVVQGWNHLIGVPVVGVSNPSSTIEGAMMSAWTGPTRLAMAQIPNIKMVAQDVSSESEALKRAQLIFEDHAKRFVQGWVKVHGDPTIQLGCRIKVTGTDSRFGNPLECYRIVHSVSGTDGFTTTAVLRGTSL